MPRVPITVMGFRCAQCGHEWIPRSVNHEPKRCPGCDSIRWNLPTIPATTYETFRDSVVGVLRLSEGPLTWTEIRTKTRLPQLFPNNQWVRRLERDIGLLRERDRDGIMLWRLGEGA